MSITRVRRGRHHRHAFTVIELVVVMAIIAVLVSMVLPMVRRVKGMANAQRCLSAQRQCVQGCIAYATEHRGAIPSLVLRQGPPIVFWSNLIFPDYLEARVDADRQHHSYVGSVLQGCPDWVAGAVKTTKPLGSADWDMAYGLNRFPCYNASQPNQVDSYFGSSSPRFAEFRLQAISHHSTRLLLADSQSLTGGSQAYVANWGGPSYTEAVARMKTWHAIGQKMNITFFDGHGETRPFLDAIRAISDP